MCIKTWLRDKNVLPSVWVDSDAPQNPLTRKESRTIQRSMLGCFADKNKALPCNSIKIVSNPIECQVRYDAICNQKDCFESASNSKDGNYAKSRINLHSVVEKTISNALKPAVGLARYMYDSRCMLLCVRGEIPEKYS